MVLMFVSMLLVGALYILRKVRRSKARQQLLPTHNDPSRPNTANHRRQLTVTATPYKDGSNIYVYDEKSSADGQNPPLSPGSVPEIRITFPDEHDEATGRKKSGRVLIVRVGETSVGLEPLKESDQLPAYEKETGARFTSIDMERIGGLKEKSSWN